MIRVAGTALTPVRLQDRDPDRVVVARALVLVAVAPVLVLAVVARALLPSASVPEADPLVVHLVSDLDLVEEIDSFFTSLSILAFPSTRTSFDSPNRRDPCHMYHEQYGDTHARVVSGQPSANQSLHCTGQWCRQVTPLQIHQCSRHQKQKGAKSPLARHALALRFEER